MTYAMEQIEQMMRKNGGSLNLRHTAISSLPNNLTVLGDLDLSYTQITSLPKNLMVGGRLNLRYTPTKSIPKSLTVGGDLDLSYTRLTWLPNNFIVGADLDLRSTPLKSLPRNLTVGGNLYLGRTKITSVPDNCAVGGDIYCGCMQIKNHDYYLHLQNGDYVEKIYLFADGILTHIKRVEKVGGYVFYVGKIPGRNVLFDGKYYAHCKTLRDGVRDIEFKRAANTSAEQQKTFVSLKR